MTTLRTFYLQLLTLTLLLVLVPTVQVSAQTNYIVNGGFENGNCPWTWSQIGNPGWRLPPNHSGSSDYYNACATIAAMDVPVNWTGNVPAAQGNAYVGGYITIGSGTGTYREYICDTLSQALVAGQQYVVSFQYRLSAGCQYASDDLGFLLSATMPTGSGTGSLGVTPTSQNASGNYLTNNTSWATYADTITATGGELYITIGSFNTFPAVSLINSSATWGTTYMFYDEVSIVDHHLVSGDSFVCVDSTALVYASLLETVYWVDSLNPSTVISTQDSIWVSPTVTTTYLAIGDTTGDTFSWTVEVVNMPTSFVGPDSVLCEGDTFVRAVNMPGYTYLWSDTGTDSVLITMDSGYHSLTVELHGCHATDSFHLEYHDFPQYSLGNDTSICDYETLTLSTGLTATGLSYEWNNGTTGQTLTVSDSGIYWVDVTNATCTKRDSIEVSLHPHVSVDLGSNENLCYLPDSNITVNSQAGNSFVWSTAQTGSSITVSSSGSYYVTATNNGCTAMDSVQLTFHYDPAFSLGNDTSYCKEDSLVLRIDLDPNTHNFIWNNGIQTQSQTIQHGVQGMFWAQADNGICVMRDTIVVTEYPRMDLELGENQRHCKGDVVTITPNTNSSLSYLWNDGSTLPYLEVTTDGAYSLTVSDGFCSETDQVSIFFHDIPEVSIGNDTIICAPSELHFIAQSDAHSYRWYNGSISDQHVLYVIEDTTIWVKASNTVCSGYDTLHIDLHNPPHVDIDGDTLLCYGETVSLTVLGDSGWNYVWSDGTVGEQLETGLEGEYTVTVSDGICTAEIEAHVKAYEQADLQIIAPEYICTGEQVLLDATHEGMYYYQWSDLSHDSTTTISSPGFYSVEAWDVCGVYRDTVLVQDCECYLRLPSAFRPTPAGINQTFGPKADCEFDKYEFTVFDRWGEIIFQTKSIDEHWDGTYRGVDAQSGAYGWKIDYKAQYNGHPFRDVMSGVVVLLR